MQLRECLLKSCVERSSWVSVCSGHAGEKSKRGDRKGKREKGGNDAQHRSQEHVQCHHLLLLSWNTDRPCPHGHKAYPGGKEMRHGLSCRTLISHSALYVCGERKSTSVSYIRHEMEA